jgi:tRNA-binding EMAP/Myf-like protein
VSPAHQQAFDQLVNRSRARTAGADRIAAAASALNAAVMAGVESQGFTLAERSDGEDVDEIRFDGEPGQSLTVTLGHLPGDEPEEVRAGDVVFGVRFQASGAFVETSVVEAPSGAVVVAADEWTGQGVSSVSLLLPLEDYLGTDLSVASDAVQHDVAATVAVVRSHLV